MAGMKIDEERYVILPFLWPGDSDAISDRSNSGALDH